MLMEIIISQNELNPNISINEQENQLLYVDGGGNVIGISDVLVNGSSVVNNGIAYILVPTKTSELMNDSGFITSELDPTVPYYVKQISISDINNWNSKQNALVSGANIKTINNNSLLGSGNIDITGNVYTAGTGISIDSNNIITNEVTSYNDLTDLPTIPSKISDLVNDNDFVSDSQLSEVAFTGSYTSLSDTPDDLSYFNNDTLFVNETDYASNSTGGVIKTGINSYDINSSGYLYADTQTYADYGNLSNTNFIGKGTLENVISGKGLIDNTVNNLTNYTLSSNLSTVATSGDYDDLTNKPTIPTVNDGTLTIQVNGTTVNTFSANSSSNITTNISVPTTTSQLTNTSGYINNTEVVNYSSTEKVIGTWINGKPLYRKVYEFTLTSSGYTFSSYSLGLSNVDKIYINGNSFIQTSNNTFYQLNIGRYQSNTFAYNNEYSWFRCNRTDVNYSIGDTLAGGTCYLIVEYTKTTD